MKTALYDSPLSYTILIIIPFCIIVEIDGIVEFPYTQLEMIHIRPSKPINIFLSAIGPCISGYWPYVSRPVTARHDSLQDQFRQSLGYTCVSIGRTMHTKLR